MPGDPEFVTDWVGVGDDEARHFEMVADRLEAMGSHYGALPAHDGLWDSAQTTAGALDARLAVAPMVLEARGLDVTPGMIERLMSAGDRESAEILRIIYEEEVGHVAAGARWFRYLCEKSGHEPASHFQTLVTKYFRGRLNLPSIPMRASVPICRRIFTAPSSETAQLLHWRVLISSGLLCHMLAQGIWGRQNLSGVTHVITSQRSCLGNGSALVSGSADLSPE